MTEKKDDKMEQALRLLLGDDRFQQVNGLHTTICSQRKDLGAKWSIQQSLMKFIDVGMEEYFKELLEHFEQRRGLVAGKPNSADLGRWIQEMNQAEFCAIFSIICSRSLVGVWNKSESRCSFDNPSRKQIVRDLLRNCAIHTHNLHTSPSTAQSAEFLLAWKEYLEVLYLRDPEGFALYGPDVANIAQSGLSFCMSHDLHPSRSMGTVEEIVTSILFDTKEAPVADYYSLGGAWAADYYTKTRKPLREVLKDNKGDANA